MNRLWVEINDLVFCWLAVVPCWAPKTAYLYFESSDPHLSEILVTTIKTIYGLHISVQ